MCDGCSANFILAVMVEGGILATEITGLHAFGRFVSAANTLLAFIGILEITSIAHTEIDIVGGIGDGGVCSGGRGFRRAVEADGRLGRGREGSNITPGAEEVTVISLVEAWVAGGASQGRVVDELFVALSAFTCLHGSLTKVLVGASGMAILAGGLTSEILILVTGTLLTNVRVTNGRDEVFEVSSGTFVTGLGGNLA